MSKKKKFTIKVNISGKLRRVYAIFKEISWPSKKDLLVYSIAVLIISVIITAYLVGLDNLFNFIRLNLIFK